jgi:hypothetical protein
LVNGFVVTCFEITNWGEILFEVYVLPTVKNFFFLFLKFPPILYLIRILININFLIELIEILIEIEKTMNICRSYLILIPSCYILVTGDFLEEYLFEKELRVDLIIVHPEVKKIVLSVIVDLVLEFDIKLFFEFCEQISFIEILKKIPIDHSSSKKRLIQLLIEILDLIIIIPHEALRKVDLASLPLLDFNEVELIDALVFTAAADSDNIGGIVEQVGQELVECVVGVAEDQNWRGLERVPDLFVFQQDFHGERANERLARTWGTLDNRYFL